MAWENILAVTSRKLCTGDFGQQAARVGSRHPQALILREKDLSPEAYGKLARQIAAICRQYDVPLILHNFPQVAEALGAEGLHLPLPLLRALAAAQRQRWLYLGTSCHSVDDVREAVALGCTYLVAGHIYETDCKRGVPGRGLAFLRAACEAAGKVPVYAIGGITPDRLAEVQQAGAAGACVMSGMMRDSDWWR